MGNSERKSPGKIQRSQKKPPICGNATRLYYDSLRRSSLPGIRMDELVCFAELAIHLYNIKELTHFAQVKVLRAVATYSGLIDFRITFQAFSPLGVAPVFVTKVRQFVGAFPNIEIRFVRIKHSHSDRENSQQDLPCNIHEQQHSQVITTPSSVDSVNDLTPYLSQLSLVMYNIFALRVKKDAVHDIPSLKVVEAIKHVADSTTYLITFEASLRDESKNVETFEAQICMPTLFPTTTIEFKKVQIKHD